MKKFYIGYNLSNSSIPKICKIFSLIILQVFFNFEQQIYAQTSSSKIIAGGDKKVMIIDYKGDAKRNPKVVWTWTNESPSIKTSNSKSQILSKITDCKSINNGKRILVISEDGELVILNKLNKQIVYQSKIPHLKNAEQLPKGYLITISTHSERPKTKLYHLHKGARPIFTDSTFAVQALAWDQDKKQIWIMDDQVLRQIKVGKHDQLAVVKELKLPITMLSKSEMAIDQNLLRIKGIESSVTFDLKSFAFSEPVIHEMQEQVKISNQVEPIELNQLPPHDEFLSLPLMTYRYQNMLISRIRKF